MCVWMEERLLERAWAGGERERRASGHGHGFIAAAAAVVIALLHRILVVTANTCT